MLNIFVNVCTHFQLFSWIFNFTNLRKGVSRNQTLKFFELLNLLFFLHHCFPKYIIIEWKFQNEWPQNKSMLTNINLKNFINKFVNFSRITEYFQCAWFLLTALDWTYVTNFGYLSWKKSVFFILWSKVVKTVCRIFSPKLRGTRIPTYS